MKNRIFQPHFNHKRTFGDDVTDPPGEWLLGGQERCAPRPVEKGPVDFECGWWIVPVRDVGPKFPRERQGDACLDRVLKNQRDVIHQRSCARGTRSITRSSSGPTRVM